MAKRVRRQYKEKQYRRSTIRRSLATIPVNGRACPNFHRHVRPPWPFQLAHRELDKGWRDSPRRAYRSSHISAGRGSDPRNGVEGNERGGHSGGNATEIIRAQPCSLHHCLSGPVEHPVTIYHHQHKLYIFDPAFEVTQADSGLTPRIDKQVTRDRLPMAKHAIPNTGRGLRVSTPIPDMLYGKPTRHVECGGLW